MKTREIVTVPRKVEVTFLVAGIGPTRETYDLGYAEHLLCWSMNERLTKGIQTGIRITETVDVPKPMARQIERSRGGMKPYIDKRLSEARQRMSRGAASGS